MQKQKHRDMIVKLEVTNAEGVHVVYRGAEGERDAAMCSLRPCAELSALLFPWLQRHALKG